MLPRPLLLPQGRVTYDCGPETLCAVMAYWGRPVAVELASRHLQSAERRGTLPPELVEFAQQQGFAAEPQRGSIAALKDLLEKGRPPILTVRVRPGVYHHLVAFAYSDIARSVACPDYGGRWRLIPYEELEERWAAVDHSMIVLTPADARSEFELGSAEERNGRWKEALHHFRRAAAADPGHAGARLGMGNSLRALGRMEEARAAYEEALRAAPEDPGALNNLADLMLSTVGAASEAARLAVRAVAALRGDRGSEAATVRLAYALGTLGEARFREQHPAEAEAAWKESLDLLPAPYADARVRRMLDLARATGAQGRTDEAREWTRRAAETRGK